MRELSAGDWSVGERPADSRRQLWTWNTVAASLGLPIASPLHAAMRCCPTWFFGMLATFLISRSCLRRILGGQAGFRK